MKYLLCLIITVLLGCSNVPSCCSLDNPKVIAYGDSITYGVYGVSYAKRMATMWGYDLINNAVPGSNIESPNQCKKILADSWASNSIIIFMPGANDAPIQTPEHVDFYSSCMDQIGAKLGQSNVRVFIATPIQVLPNPSFTNEMLKVYSDINVQMAAKYGFKLIDFFNTYVPDSKNNYDYEHPNDLGYEQMTQIFRDSL